MGRQLGIRSHQRSISVILLTLYFALVVAGCKKKAPPPAPPPAPKTETPKPAPSAPAISQFEAEPSTIEKGQSATLRWTVSGETTDISIAPGIGTVPASGNRRVFPSETAVYTLKVEGPGGTDSRDVTVTVRTPAPPPEPKPPQPTKTLSERLATEVQDIYFDYDKSEVRSDATGVLTRNAESLKAILRDFPNQVIVLEGHADERGSAEYNLGLSDRRATSAKEFLVQLGVPGDRLRPVTYGKERPQCTESNEQCWQLNRRVHFSAGQ